MSNKLHNVLILVVVPLIIICVTFASVMSYQRSAIQRSRELSYKTLQNSANEQIAIFDSTLDGQYAILETLANSFAGNDEMDNDEIRELLDAVANSTDFVRIFWITPDGDAYANDGSVLDASERNYFKAGMAGRSTIEMLSSGRIDFQPRFIISQPVTYNGEVTGIVAGSYDETMFRNLLISDIYDNEAFAFICDSNGDIVVGSNNSSSLVQGNNIISLLNDYEFEDGLNSETLLSNLKNGRAGTVSYKKDGEKSYAIYQTVGVNDWVIFNVVPGFAVDADTDEVTNNGYRLITIIMLMALFAIIFMYFVYRRQTHLINKEKEKIRISDERFKIALNNTTVSIWDYDYKTKCIIQTKHSMDMHGFGRIVSDVPESLVECGYVHPDSVEKFLIMYENLSRGAKIAEGIFRMRKKDGPGYWYEHIRYTNVFNKAGTPSRAIGTSEDVTAKVEMDRQYELEMQMRKTLAPDIYSAVSLNISKCIVEEIKTEVADEKKSLESVTFDNIFKREAGRVINNETIRRRLLVINAQKLHEAYDDNQKTITFEYMRKNPTGEEMWVLFEIHILLNPKSGELYAFVYLKNIDKQKREYLELEKRAKSDSLTGLANAQTVKTAIADYINGDGNNQLNAFFLIDLDNFKNINDTFSHYEGDCILIRIAGELEKLFLSTDIIGRIGGDEFVVFIKNAASTDYIESKAREVCEALQFTITSEDKTMDVSCSIGIAVCKDGNKTFNILYKEADIALYNAKDRGKNCFAFSADVTDDLLKGADTEIIKKAKEMVQQSANTTVQLSALLEYMNGGVLLIEVAEQFKSLYISPSFYTSMDSNNQTFDTTNIKLMQMVHAGDRKMLELAIREGAKNGTVIDIAYRVTLDNTHEGWRHMRAVKIPYEGSNNPVIIAVITDITELRESSLQLKAILDYAPSGIARVVISDEAWIVDFSNDECMSIFGVTREIYEKRFAKDARMLVHPDDFDSLDRTVKIAIESGKPFVDVYRAHTTSHKAEMWIQMHGVMLGTKNDAPVMLCIFNNITEQKMLENQLNEDRLKLSLAFEQTDLILWEYDRNNKTVYVYENDVTYTDVPLANIKRGFISKDSVQDYLDFYKQMNSGASEGSCVLRVSHFSGSFNWYRFSFKNIFDDSGALKKAVGVTEKFPHIDARKAQLEHEEKFRVAISGELISSVKANLTRSTVDAFYVQDENCLKNDAIKTYENFLEAEAAAIADNEDLYNYRVKLSAEALISSYEMGNKWIFVEYRRTNKNGQIDWVSNNVNLIADPVSGELYAFGYIRNVDVRKRWELSLDRKAERDTTTFMYNAETTEAMVKYVLSKTSPDAQALCAFLIVELQGIDWINENLGFNVANATLFNIGRLYRILLDNKYVVGTVGGNVIAVFMPEIESMEWLRKKENEITNIVRSLRQKSSINDRVTIVTGASVSKMVNTTYSILYYGAQRAIKKANEIPFGQFAPLQIEQNLPDVQKETEKPSVGTGDGLLDYRYLDVLTQINNRNKYSETITAINDVALSSLGVAFADINGLSRLNREMGNEYGDKMLVDAASVLAQQFGRESVYRISGDEFIVLAQNLSLRSFTEKANDAIKQYAQLYPTGISLGYTWADKDIKVQELVDNAESFMRIGKRAYYEKEEASGRRERPEILKKLLSDIADGHYVVYLQPKAEIETKNIVGAEALVRYMDPVKGTVISPDKFIPLFEKEGIINHVDMFVLEKTVQMIKVWHDKGKRTVPVAVNFSRVTLLDKNSLSNALKIMQKYDVDVSMIEIEITESVGNVERAMVAAECKKYTDAGIRLSIDDFGSEYSSLSILSAIRFDVLKIDKSLVNDVVSNEASRAIVENIVSVCKKLGMTVVAEGVESESQMQALMECGCIIAQGYYFNKPLPSESFENKYIFKVDK